MASPPLLGWLLAIRSRSSKTCATIQSAGERFAARPCVRDARLHPGRRLPRPDPRSALGPVPGFHRRPVPASSSPTIAATALTGISRSLAIASKRPR